MNSAESRPLARWAPLAALLAGILAAAALRLPGLDLRPMHADEAILADITGTLLETGSYRYDPRNFHGPALHYAAAVLAWLTGARTYAALDERLLRAVPAVFGILLAAGPWLIRRGMGRRAAAGAVVLAAVSPAMVYYSRYYIPEMVLVCATFGTIACGWRYAWSRKAGWAAGCGCCAGLMWAAKETSILAFAAMAAALALARAAGRSAGGGGGRPPVAKGHLALGIGAAFLTAGLLLSSFLGNPSGIVGPFHSYEAAYLDRALHSSAHAHPWSYYFSLLLWFREPGGPLWSEGAILLLGMAGLVAAFRGALETGADPRLVRFLAWYAPLITLAYALIPYKTPWCALTFLHGWILLAGVGAASLPGLAGARPARIPVAVAVAAAGVHLAGQAYSASYLYAADPRNPYVYGHTAADVFLIRDRLEALAAADPRGRALPVQVFSKENLWPLPWYFRPFPGIQWWTGVPDDVPSAPVILATPEMEPALSRRLYELPPPGERELYMRMFERPVYLRPGVELRGYVAKRLWDRR